MKTRNNILLSLLILLAPIILALLIVELIRQDNEFQRNALADRVVELENQLADSRQIDMDNITKQRQQNLRDADLIKELEERLAAVSKKADDFKQAYDNAVAELNSTIAKQEAFDKAYQQWYDKWEARNKQDKK